MGKFGQQPAAGGGQLGVTAADAAAGAETEALRAAQAQQAIGVGGGGSTCCSRRTRRRATVGDGEEEVACCSGLAALCCCMCLWTSASPSS